MTTNPDARPEPLYVIEHEGETVRAHRAVLPRQVLEMDAGYVRNTHLIIQVEARVREVAYPEQRSGGQKGELIREHQLTVESVALVDTMTSAAATPAVGGSASSRIAETYLHTEDAEECYYDATEVVVVHRGGCGLCAPDRPAEPEEEPEESLEDEDGNFVMPPDIVAAFQRAAAIETGEVVSEVGF